MLAKLFKDEMKGTSRLFLPLIAGFILITVLCKFAFETSFTIFDFNNYILQTITVIFFTLYFIYIIALYVLTSVFIVVRFYQTMTGKQAYLTHTLPIKTSTLINAKLICAVLWELITGVLFILSLVFFFLGHIHLSDIQTFIRDVGIIVKELNQYVNIPLFTAVIFISCILSLLSGPLMMYACVAMGHLFRTHRVLWAVVSYFIIYILIQIIATIGMFFCGYDMILWSNTATSVSNMVHIMERYMIFAVILSAGFTAGCYAVTNYVFHSHLNLN